MSCNGGPMKAMTSSVSSGVCPSDRKAASVLAAMPGRESMSVPSRSSNTEWIGDMAEHSVSPSTSKPPAAWPLPGFRSADPARAGLPV